MYDVVHTHNIIIFSFRAVAWRGGKDGKFLLLYKKHRIVWGTLVTQPTYTICLDIFFVKTPIIKHADINPIFLEPISLFLSLTPIPKDIQESSSKEVSVINLSFFLFFWFHFIIIIIFFSFFFFGTLYSNKTNDIIFAVT